MPTKTRSRLIELLIAIAVVAGALVWAERTAWRQISSLRAEMTVDQITRFRSADALRAALLDLHATWRRGFDDTTNRVNEEIDCRTVEELLKAMASKAGSSMEKQLNNELALAFAEYRTRVSKSLRISTATGQSAASRPAMEEVESSLEQLLSLNEKLTAANRAAAERFVTDTNAALTRLQRFLFAALLGLLVSGIAIIGMAYRRTIAPLRSNLTESRAIIERQEKLSSLGVFAAGIAHEIRN